MTKTLLIVYNIKNIVEVCYVHPFSQKLSYPFFLVACTCMFCTSKSYHNEGPNDRHFFLWNIQKFSQFVSNICLSIFLTYAKPRSWFVPLSFFTYFSLRTLAKFWQTSSISISFWILDSKYSSWYPTIKILVYHR